MKRIVLRHTYGGLRGLDQIVGLWTTGSMPAHLADAHGAADLVGVTERAVTYRTVAPTPEGQGANSPSGVVS